MFARHYWFRAYVLSVITFTLLLAIVEAVGR